MSDKANKNVINKAGMTFSRREFLKASGIIVIGVGVGGCTMIDPLPASQGYLLVDTKKCQGCVTCMLACSLVHEGFESLSLARIQIVQNPFEGFPADINIAQCRQCVEPACVAVCPVKALHVDRWHGNVRTVNTRKCIGCKACIAACPFPPGRPIWNFQEGYAQKCDLCTSSGFWNEKGGPAGKQACVTVCPMKALQFTDQIPVQTGTEGYNVNLRDESWGLLGYTTE